MKQIMLALAVALSVTGCKLPTPKTVEKKVVEVGECKDVWGGCLVCGVMYQDGTGGTECSPVIGASYQVRLR